MGGFGPFSGAGSLSSSQVERVLATVTVDANSAVNQTLYTCVGSTYITRLIFDNASTSLTLAVAKVGFDAGASNVVAAQALSALTGATLSLGVAPIAGAVVGSATAVLKFNTTVQQGSAATVRCLVMGVGG